MNRGGGKSISTGEQFIDVDSVQTFRMFFLLILVSRRLICFFYLGFCAIYGVRNCANILIFLLSIIAMAELATSDDNPIQANAAAMTYEDAMNSPSPQPRRIKSFLTNGGKINVIGEDPLVGQAVTLAAFNSNRRQKSKYGLHLSAKPSLMTQTDR